MDSQKTIFFTEQCKADYKIVSKDP